MTERIDHVAEARRCGKRAEQAVTDTGALAQLVSAQAHATLALVEQQRIANIIAVGEQFDFIGEPDEWQRERVLRTDIREGLGL